MSKENYPMLHLVGIGPGDPELMTIKALRLIKECDVIFAPVKKKDIKKSNALDIVSKLVDISNKRVVYLYFPMVKGESNMRPYFGAAAEDVKKNLKKEQTGVFITVGCSTIYSTPGNLFKVLEGVCVNFVPGISSINASAAAVGEPLVYSEDKLAVLPATYSIEELESVLDQFDTVLLMKANTSLDLIIKMAKSKGLEKSSYLVEKASSKEEKITVVADIPEGYKPHYMSSVIIKKSKRGVIDGKS